MAFTESLARRLRFRDLRLLVALSEHRNLQRVAGELGVTQPAITKMLKELEATLGCTLFARNTRRVAPTEIGILMARHATVMLANLDLISRQVEAARRGVAGMRRIGVIPYAAPVLLPRAIQAIARAAPDLRLSIVEGMTDSLIDILSRGHLDLVIGRVSGRSAGQPLRQQHLYAERGLVIAGSTHPLTTRRRIELRDCMAYPWILAPEGSPTRIGSDNMFARSGLTPPVAAIETFSFTVLINLLPNSSFLSILPESVVRHHVRSGAIAVIGTSAACELPVVSLYALRDTLEDPALVMIENALHEVATALTNEGAPITAGRRNSNGSTTSSR